MGEALSDERCIRTHLAGRLVRAAGRPDQEVAASEFSFVLVDGKPDMQATGHQNN